MADERARSEYRFTIAPSQFVDHFEALHGLREQDRDGLAQLMLDAYRGSVDDEGETFAEACEAIDFYIGKSLRDHSFVLKDEGVPVAMSLVIKLDFNGVHYIDPVAVTASHKGTGIGRKMVEASLISLRLFASLGAIRVGPWPPS